MEDTAKPSKIKPRVRAQSSGSDSGIDVYVSSKSSKYELLNTYVPNSTTDKSDKKTQLKTSKCRIEECTSTQSEQIPEKDQDRVPPMKIESSPKKCKEAPVIMEASSQQQVVSSLFGSLINMHEDKERFSSNIDSYHDISRGEIHDSSTDDDDDDDDMDESVSQSNVPLNDSHVSVQNITNQTVTDGKADERLVAQKLDSDSGFSACSPSSTSAISTNDSNSTKKERYKRTADALQGSGLMDVTMKTAELLKKNRVLQKEIDQFKKESALFLEKVMNNPENADLREILLKEQGVIPKKLKLATSTVASSKSD